MNLTTSRESLLKPLQAVIGVVERRQTMPILANVLLIARNGLLSVTATDLEVELVADAPVDEVTNEGEITVPARKLLDICRALPDESTVNLRLDGDRMVVKSGRSRFVLSTLPAGDFPSSTASTRTGRSRLARAMSANCSRRRISPWRSRMSGTT